MTSNLLARLSGALSHRSCDDTGIDPATYEAQARYQAANSTPAAAAAPLAAELEVLAELAALTAGFREDGPWKAAEALFSPSPLTGPKAGTISSGRGRCAGRSAAATDAGRRP